MSQREKHLFQFTGKQISEAASREAAYHAERLIFWKGEHKRAVDKAKESGLEVSEYPVTGGVYAQMVINPTLQERLTVCANKIHKHRKEAETLTIEADCYGTQPDRSYELDGTDVVYFRLAGGPREE